MGTIKAKRRRNNTAAFMLAEWQRGIGANTSITCSRGSQQPSKLAASHPVPLGMVTAAALSAGSRPSHH
eukprot:scaffold3619_cov328-Prasinococcus_capsulatus_cf.AAC.1